eukprot:6457677-Amphidinium_carterae.1
MSLARVDDAVLALWQTALQEGHRSLRIADKLLGSAWIAPCPLPVDAPEQVIGVDDAETYTDIIVVGLHWAGPPDSGPTSALLALPEAAAHGVQGAVAMQAECFYMDGQLVDTASIV